MLQFARTETLSLECDVCAKHTTLGSIIFQAFKHIFLIRRIMIFCSVSPLRIRLAS